ncbi:myogenesis-regulating glycosidase-like [Galleria mellonella]|uniref:Myogenesis-regulating glycosidase-like n=1 Tax=Galleria mellonella TaxID=7137 RepID=A0A6J3BWN5_GALME|nr:myogenesis-regulating glycosidase-like [Galleria mellonella]
MAPIGSILAFLALGARAFTAHAPAGEANTSHQVRIEDVMLTLIPQLTGGFQVNLITENEETTIGHIGRSLVSSIFITEEIEGGVEVQIGGANLTIHTVSDTNARGIKVKWVAPTHLRLEDCFNFGKNHWYGGPMQLNQLYPIEKAQQIYSPYVSKSSDNAAIVERYWLNSAGQYIYVHPQVPLFVDYSNILGNHICFGAQIADPYSSKRPHIELSYDIWLLGNVKEAHKHAVANYLGKPSDTPDYRMVQHPIWSTWAQFGVDINETNLLEFAYEIREHGFNDSQFEIDDLWEECYGSLTVDENKFPNFTDFVQELKDLGYRVTVWVHPFINKNCEPWYTEALSKGYLVLDESGSPNGTWWNSNGTDSGYVDFTNPNAAEWWYGRVMQLRDVYDIDSFKFDAGETDYAPQISEQRGDINLQPHHIVEAYVRTCARFGNMVEVRTGFRTQDLPIFVRMVDRDSIWGLNNGLSSVITTTLQMNLNGYTLVLPDMIGGNGFNLDHDQADLPSKELFIRWVQANTFLPAMQYSFVPWNFDNETIEISKKYTELHAEYADVIFDAMLASVNNGTPVNPPIWWLDPTDEEALVIWDQYLLGETILVAPILEEGKTSRDIYLPKGIWWECGDPAKVHAGPAWIHNYPAPIDVLPYFVRDTSSEPDSATTPTVTILLLFLGVVANFVNLY